VGKNENAHVEKGREGLALIGGHHSERSFCRQYIYGNGHFSSSIDGYVNRFDKRTTTSFSVPLAFTD